MERNGKDVLMATSERMSGIVVTHHPYPLLPVATEESKHDTAKPSPYRKKLSSNENDFK